MHIAFRYIENAFRYSLNIFTIKLLKSNYQIKRGAGNAVGKVDKMESITVITEKLVNAANKVDNIAAEYERTYGALLNDVSTFTQTDWKGDDADAFRNKVEGFRDDFANMKNLMNEYANHLRKSAKLYEDTQLEIRRKNESQRN